MRRFAFRIAIALGLWLCAGLGLAADGVEKRYPLFEHGTFVVSLPAGWKDEVRQNVERGIAAVKSQALEKEIRVIEFPGKSGAGYYFEATDRAPKAGEYKFLRHGMLMVDDLLVAFAILTNDREEQVMRDAMDMMRSATHAPKQQ